MSDLVLEYHVPPDDLKSYVTLFYVFRSAKALFDDTERADHAQLRFRLSLGEGSYTFGTRREQPAASCHVIGPTNVALRVQAIGPVEVVGLGLQPAGWAAMLGIEASAMVNRVVDGTTLFGALADDALAAMRAADGDDAKLAIAEELVRSLVARGGSRSLDFARQIDAWLAGSSSPDLETLIAATGLSRRQVERRCNALYGAPPKMLARKYRALRAAVALSSGTSTIDALIGDGFYDQSHLIRELKQFTGHTPRQLLAQRSGLAGATMRQRRALEGKVHPIITSS